MTPFVQRGAVFAIRSTRAGSESFLKEIRQAVWSVNPDLPLARIRTMEEIYRGSMARSSFTLVMLAIAGGMALLLGVVGIYGVISYSVSQRTREIGIRIALGAQPLTLKTMVVRHGVCSRPLAWRWAWSAPPALTRLMSSLLFEISPVDPLTYGAVSAGLLWPRRPPVIFPRIEPHPLIRLRLCERNRGAVLSELPDALSLCMIVKNEERNLPRCLDSVQGLTSEFIVVDTGSTDQTRSIAAGYGAQVIPFDFSIVDFAAARNHAIAHARGQWILMLDADEALAPESAPKIEKLSALGENAGYFLERHNHASDSETPVIDYVVRLFPNRPDYRYRGRVHEIIDRSIQSGGGRLFKTDIRIDHNFSSDREARRRKNHWYIEILKEEIAADPTDDTRLDFLAAEYHQLEMFDEAVEIAERIVRVRPLDARAHYFLGVYHLLYKADLVRARADFNQALKLRPGYTEAASFLQQIDQQERAK